MNAEISKLRWRCRRGMRELDRILEQFLEFGFPRLSDSEKQSFARFLELPDPDLHAYLIGRAMPAEAELASILEIIRQSHSGPH